MKFISSVIVLCSALCAYEYALHLGLHWSVEEYGIGTQPIQHLCASATVSCNYRRIMYCP